MACQDVAKITVQNLLFSHISSALWSLAPFQRRRAMSCQNLTKVTGEHLLFLGTSTANWSIQQFQDAARFARAHNVDHLLLKTADGSNWWYGGIAGYRQRRDAIKTQGIGVIPYTYSYGNKYEALDAEINILLALLAEPENVVIADMETEWNGQTAWGSHLASRIQGKGTFLVSTWADPNLQNWQGLIQALNPCVSAYMPQQYNNYLASCWPQFAAAGAACLQPTVNMTQDFGPNDPVSIARAAHNQGHTAISVWYYETAVANPSLLDAIYTAFPKGEQSMSIDLTTPGVSNYFEGSDDVWRCKQTDFLVGHGILSFYQKFGGDALCGLTYLGLPTSNEIGVSGHPGLVYQRFERAVLAYDPQHIIDSPPGAGDVYCMHIDSGLGQDPRITQLQALIAQLQQSISTLVPQILPTPQSPPTSANQS